MESLLQQIETNSLSFFFVVLLVVEVLVLDDVDVVLVVLVLVVLVLVVLVLVVVVVVDTGLNQMARMVASAIEVSSKPMMKHWRMRHLLE